MDSAYFNPGTIVGFLVAGLLAAIVALLVSALLLRLAVRLVEGFAPPYARCVLVAFLAALLGGIVNVAISSVLPVGATLFGFEPRTGMPALVAIAGLVGIAIAIGAGMVMVLALVRRPEGAPLPLERAFRIAAVHVGMELVLYGVLVFALVLVLGGVPGVSR